MGRGTAVVCQRRQTTRSEERKHSPVSPGERVGTTSACIGVFRRRQRTWPSDSLGIRGQPADRYPAWWIRAERLLRSQQQVTAVLLLRERRGHGLHVPLVGYRVSRIRPRCP